MLSLKPGKRTRRSRNELDGRMLRGRRVRGELERRGAYLYVKVGMIQCIGASGRFSSLLGPVEVLSRMSTRGFNQSSVSRGPPSSSEPCLGNGALPKSDENYTETLHVIGIQSELLFLEHRKALKVSSHTLARHQPPEFNPSTISTALKRHLA